MKLLLNALCMTAVIGAPCFAAEKAPAYPSWVYPCPKVTSSPTIDGKNDDATYRNAPVAGGFVDYHRPKQYIKPTTTFQVVHDGKTLYFAFHCEEPEIAEFKIEDPKGRDAIAAVGETVEVFIDVNHNHDDYYQWIVGLNRDLYDAHGTDKSWDSSIEYAVHRGDDHWGMELAIPLEQIGLNGRLDQWHVTGIRVCRNRWRPLESGRWWSSWSAGGFHDPDSYDHLVICDEKGQIPSDKLEELMPTFRWKNNKSGPVLLVAATGSNGESFADLGRARVERANLHLAELEQLTRRLQQHVENLRTRLDGLNRQAPSLNAGTYPVFVLDVDQQIEQTESAYWAARKQALIDVLTKSP